MQLPGVVAWVDADAIQAPTVLHSSCCCVADAFRAVTCSQACTVSLSADQVCPMVTAWWRASDLHFEGLCREGLGDLGDMVCRLCRIRHAAVADPRVVQHQPRQHLRQIRFCHHFLSAGRELLGGGPGGGAARCCNLPQHFRHVDASGDAAEQGREWLASS